MPSRIAALLLIPVNRIGWIIWWQRPVRLPCMIIFAPFDIACLSDLPKIGGDEVGDPGRARGAKLADRILNDTIRVRHALVLPEVLEP